MGLSLGDYEERTRQAVAHFWGARAAAARAQLERGIADAGSRGAVTAGKNMDGFRPLVEAILRENGLQDAVVSQNKGVKTLPGYFRPTKNWDYVVTHRGRLVAIVEMKSQVGSFGNNFNNRCEEALGSAVDFWTAFRYGAFGPGAAPPFLGYVMLVEDCHRSREIVRIEPSAFPAFPEFANTSYINRYQHLCWKLMSERLYTIATVLTTPTGSVDGTYSEECETTGLRRFVSGFAAAVAGSAAEQ